MRDESALTFASVRVESTLAFATDLRASSATAPPLAARATLGGAAGGDTEATLSAATVFAVATSAAAGFALGADCKESII